MKNENTKKKNWSPSLKKESKSLTLEVIPGAEFSFKADKIIKINNCFLILFTIQNKEVKTERNVILLDSHGNIIWQIQKNSERGWGGHYTNIYLNEENKLCVYSWGGIEYYLSIEDGSVEPHAFLK